MEPPEPIPVATKTELALVESLEHLLAPQSDWEIKAKKDHVSSSPNWNRSLVIRVLTDKEINLTGLQAAWNIKDANGIAEFDLDTFLVRFPSKGARDAVADNGPWTFNKDLIIMEKCLPGRVPSSYTCLIELIFGFT
uniref:DUF4283 domain-containing protein n=1 Tax=Nelumbo nucifera TaxID=4432 RepID=A0A822XIX5_NELNU|nr:TPA_asm: hypothetical protein HUJ06_020188 [Nelumbo nucifera]